MATECSRPSTGPSPPMELSPQELLEVLGESSVQTFFPLRLTREGLRSFLNMHLSGNKHCDQSESPRRLPCASVLYSKSHPRKTWRRPGRGPCTKRVTSSSNFKQLSSPRGGMFWSLRYVQEESWLSKQVRQNRTGHPGVGHTVSSYPKESRRGNIELDLQMGRKQNQYLPTSSVSL